MSRTVTAVFAVESIVEGDAPKDNVAQYVLDALELPDKVGVEPGTKAFPRAIGLIESSEKTVHPEWGG